jgi:hypothetical protein
MISSPGPEASSSCRALTATLPSSEHLGADMQRREIVAPVGRRGVEQLLEVVADPADRRSRRWPARVLRLSAASCGR